MNTFRERLEGFTDRPQLPQTAKAFADFMPEGWGILDSVELDFNEDGITDYVGVLEAVITDDTDDWTYPGAPRILFAVASDGAGGYRLDFQDINLIRTRGEGGVFGDPYLPLTTEGKSFTTHAYGGSAWRWLEDYTYTYLQGTWLLILSESTYGYALDGTGKETVFEYIIRKRSRKSGRTESLICH